MYMQCDDGLELFRQAIVECDQKAWEEIHRRYHILMIAWVRQCSLASTLTERYEDIADQAFARAWASLRTSNFLDFHSLAALLSYMHSCVNTVIIDLARAQATRERAVKRLSVSEVTSPEQAVIDLLEHNQLWTLLQDQVNTPQEQVILALNLVMGLPPRLILSRRPDLFGTIDSVYSTRRNFIGRLQRNPQLRNIASLV